MLWQVWIILHSWIFCWLLPVDCSTICLHLRMKQSHPFPRIRHFTVFPQPHHVVCTFLTLPSPSISNSRLFSDLSFSVCSVSIIPRAGCVSAPRHWGMWMCVRAVLGLCLHVVEQDMGTGVLWPWERVGCNWGCWVNGSQVWEWRCWQGEGIPVFCQVRHWKCQCAAKCVIPSSCLMNKSKAWVKLKAMFYYLIILVSKLRQKSEVINSFCSIGIKCNQKLTCICFGTHCWDMDLFFLETPHTHYGKVLPSVWNEFAILIFSC